MSLDRMKLVFSGFEFSVESFLTAKLAPISAYNEEKHI